MKAKYILITDSAGGLVVGIVSLILSPYLHPLFGWTMNFLFFMACVNVLYGCYSGILAWKFHRKNQISPIPIAILILGNSAWGGQCFAQVYHQFHQATVLGLGALGFEGVFVIGLAYWETTQILTVSESITEVSK